MRIWLLLLSLGLAATVAFILRDSGVTEPRMSGSMPAAGVAEAQGRAEFVVTDETVTADVKRIGMNLGSWTSWGAEALCSNVIKNPGFEGLIDRALVIVKDAGGDRFSDDVEWLGRPDDFWVGATFDVRTGAAAGQTGTIISSRRAGSSGLPDYTSSESVRRLAPGDVVSLTRQTDTELPTQWWIAQESKGLVTVAMRARPESPGVRCVSLDPVAGRDAELISYLDAIGDRAGKLLPVTGKWRLSFWSCAPDGRGSFSVKFVRKGSPAFVSHNSTPKRKWKKTTIEFSASDSGPAAILELRFKASGSNARVLLDDVELGKVQAEPRAFRDEVVRALETLKPGYLRDWQGQLGETLENWLAPAFARRTSRYRPGEETDFRYSLPDFLDLCKLVKTNPWIVMPTTMGDEEAFGLGRYLSSRAAGDGFEEILAEFGNENWNGTFRPAGIADPRTCGEAAERVFANVREGAGSNAKLLTVINGQHANPAYALDFLSQAPSADLLAVAPYFAFKLDGSSTAEAFPALFAGDGNKLRDEAQSAKRAGKEIGIYEVNLHTTEGNAPAEARDRFTASAASAAAVARTILDAIAAGARRQCVYSLAGYDSWLQDRSGFVKLWGVVRDLGGAGGKMRPAGLAVSILNRAIAGDSVRVEKASGVDDAVVYAFRSQSGWSAVVVSWSPAPRDVAILFPSVSSAPRRLLSIVADSPESTNEARELVRVTEEILAEGSEPVRLRLPAYGLCVLVSV